MAERMICVNGVDLCVETFGAATDPALLLVMGAAGSNAEALADEIPVTRLLPLDGVGHEVPPRRVWDVVIPAIVEHTGAAR